MSIKVMNAVWNLRGIPATTKLILLKLADNSDDHGVCWPSVQYIADECEVSDRTVQAAISWAESYFLIEREMRSGKATIYRIRPAKFAPPKILHPAIDDIAPPKSTTSTPEIYDVIPIEPSKEKPSKKEEPSTPAGFENFWEAYPKQRRDSKAKSLPAFIKALKKTTQEVLNEAVSRYATSDEVARGFAKGTIAWLNGERWNVDYRTPAKSTNGKPTYADSIQTAAQAAVRILDEKENLRRGGLFG